MSQHLNVYLIPGMGADHRLYERIRIEHGQVHYLNWKPHGKAKSLAEYAEIMASHVTTDNNVIVGSSMGGMMAVELSRLVKPLSTILLSAPTGRHEFPPLLKAVHKSRIQHVLSPKQVLGVSWLADTFMGFKDDQHRALFYEMLKGNGKEFMHFSVKAILDWRNTEPPHGDYIQIVGSKDKLFKVHRMKDPIVLEGSGHFTTFEKADELTVIINNYLREQVLPKLSAETKSAASS
jgi:pimeloyl-ACP methyl ester carboxylesterase